MTDVYHTFSGRDYTAAFERLLTLLRSEVPELTDLNHSDAGVSLLRLLARESDQLAFYCDQAFREGFIDTARYKQSLIDLGHLVGYPPKLPSPASVTLTISRATGVTDPISIPANTAFSRSDGKTYLTTEAATLAIGVDSIEVDALEGELITLTIHPEDLEIIDLSQMYKFNLGVNVAANSVTLSHGNPVVAWTEVDSFWRTTSTDHHFLLELYADKWADQTDTVFLVLGGAGAPGVDLTAQFIRTSGASGNTGYGTITGVPGSLLGLVTVTNADPATGGAAAEGIESLRSRIPRVTRTQRRGVVIEDYQALIESIPGVAHCQALDRNINDYWPHMYVVLYVVPEGGGVMSSYLQSLVYDELCEWGHFGDWRERYLLFNATEKAVAFTGRIGILPGYVSATVLTGVQTALESLLATSNIGIGDSLRISDVYVAANAVAGVSWAEFTAPTIDTTASNGEILVPGTITLTAVTS